MAQGDLVTEDGIGPGRKDVLLTISTLIRNLLEPQEFDKQAAAIFDSCRSFIGAKGGLIILVGEDDRAGEIVHRDLPDSISIDDEDRHMINVGSVGQPRDTDARACFGIFDTEEKNISIKRIEYDIVKTQEKMKQCGLPDFLVQRLQKGI